MSSPVKVELLAHDPAWAQDATRESAVLAEALGPVLVTVHHIGSTSIAGIHAKPIIDLIPVVTDLLELDHCRDAVEALGYTWWGEYGLPGRRYCFKSDPVTGRRLVHLHCYAQGSFEITRHLAFRDYLITHPQIARAYDQEKARCRDLHAGDMHDYSDCKDAWIKRIEAQALTWAATKVHDPRDGQVKEMR